MEITGIVNILAAVMGLIGSAFGVYKAIKARQFQQAGELSEETLRGVIAAIELLPQDPKTLKIKKTIESLSTKIGTEGPKLAALVDEVAAMLKKRKLASPLDETDGVNITKAAIAIRAARAERQRKAGMVVPLLFLAFLALAALGCQAERYTTEIVGPADPMRGFPTEIAIIWPDGVSADDVYTTTVLGGAVSVAPLPGE